MKIIVSHDVDHLNSFEHIGDLIIPKLIARSLIEFSKGFISVKEIVLRIKQILSNQLNNLNDVIEFDKNNHIPSTFFWGMSNGLGLSYKKKYAQVWIDRVIKQGLEVGVHGIAFNNENEMENEYALFKKLSCVDNFGIRMHYLRTNEQTLNKLNKCGYSFDSSVFGLQNPYKIGTLWEFPLHIMDSYIMSKGNKWQDQNLDEAKKNSLKIIEQAKENNLKYLTILLHDNYFSDAYILWKSWYVWIIQFLKDEGCQFINFKDAVTELNTNPVLSIERRSNNE